MHNSELVLFITKLVLGGIAAFLAILVWSKTRDSAWICFIGGILFSYVGIIVDMMHSMGMITSQKYKVLDVSLLTLVFTIIPYAFYIAAFLIAICRSRH
ncbi:MAG TPA: hypothetical protein VFC68_01075 [Treponemataceae bacterium]|nr:hypothetical protein [Treponemataceae bacterium]